jgi:hypothetical protein
MEETLAARAVLERASETPHIEAFLGDAGYRGNTVTFFVTGS